MFEGNIVESKVVYDLLCKMLDNIGELSFDHKDIKRKLKNILK